MFVMHAKSARKQIPMAALTLLLLAGCATAPAPIPQNKAPPPVSAPPASAAVEQPRPTAVQPTASDASRLSARERLEPQIHELWRTFPGRTGIAILAIDKGWSVSRRGDEYFPQQSVSKLWVAMAVLDQVDSGKIRLDQMVRITRDDLAVFHQPIRDRVLANGEIQETVLSLLEMAITKSDNTANDSLLRTIGGPDAVRQFINRQGLGKIRFGPGERALQAGIAGMGWQQEYAIGRKFEEARAKLSFEQRKAALDRYLLDPVDGASPVGIANGLAALSKGSLLSPASTRLLLAMMERTSSGPNRLKAGVPPDWRFGHKTGTGQQLAGVSTGYNDIGIMTAPDGSRYAVVVMMGDTTAPVPLRMEMMQAVSRAVAAVHP